MGFASGVQQPLSVLQPHDYNNTDEVCKASGARAGRQGRSYNSRLLRHSVPTGQLKRKACKTWYSAKKNYRCVILHTSNFELTYMLELTATSNSAKAQSQ